MKLYTQLLEAQKEIGAIKKDSENPYFKSKYFDINALLAEVKPVLNKYGLVLTQALSNIGGKPSLKTTISYQAEAGELEQITEETPLPEIADPQKAGSAVTYFRRYALQSMLALEAEDDDGNVASGKDKNNKTKKDPDKEVPFRSKGDAPGAWSKEDED